LTPSGPHASANDPNGKTQSTFYFLISNKNQLEHKYDSILTRLAVAPNKKFGSSGNHLHTKNSNLWQYWH
jgi:hypothetical protein